MRKRWLVAAVMLVTVAARADGPPRFPQPTLDQLSADQKEAAAEVLKQSSAGLGGPYGMLLTIFVLWTVNVERCRSVRGADPYCVSVCSWWSCAQRRIGSCGCWRSWASGMRRASCSFSWAARRSATTCSGSYLGCVSRASGMFSILAVSCLAHDHVSLRKCMLSKESE